MFILADVFLFILAKMGSQVLVPFRGSEDNPRHLKLMGDLGQVAYHMIFFFYSNSYLIAYCVFIMCSYFSYADSANDIRSKG